ncbi:calcium-binding protein [Streptomyces sp. NPDC102365]|uniref:calcium-binding protein n=1 Tax=Streptomyces sp. NPDC102365 TaxID=3366162 RepID=UPI00380F34EE
MPIRALAAATTPAAALLTALSVSPAQAAAAPVITKVVVNEGKNIVVGPTAVTKYSAQITAKYSPGISEATVHLWHGSGDYDTADGHLSFDAPRCTTSGTTTTCTMNYQVKADTRDMINVVSNAKAGTWHISAWAYGKDRTQGGSYTFDTRNVQRASKLTVNAAPEPVKKGKTITVTGALTRANWNTRTWAGYSGQKVQLQYRPKNSTTYTTLKTLTTPSNGKLSTTTKASADGYYRYIFAGTSTTPAAKATGDYVNVT